MKKNRVLILISLWTGILYGQQIDDTRYENIVKSLKLDKTKIKEELCTEKKMPNAENSYIVVVPVVVEQDEEDYVFTVQNYILITDEKGVIKNKYLDPEEISSDAIYLRNFGIDTGLYNLNTNIRAFGVIADFAGSSKPNPYASGRMSMYYPEGKTLKKVLNQFEMYSTHGEWDTRCNGEFEDNHSFIVLDKAKTNNFTDLKIKTISVKTVNTDVNGECNEKETSRTTYKILKLRGGKYQ
ncbi:MULTISPECIES: hypothetical protein [Chryseobacterium]|uniref:hypothetical protein n=1 Tax=Chryseobacterium TaxID=59732 RepID=UPI0012972368|nr:MULTISPECIES: hypothetical protein [Chryseobacterium]MDR6920744.1 hypothetical protein [Chryseobacterium sp. 2987]